MSGSKNPFFGRYHTPENKRIRSEDMSKRYKGEGNPFYNKTHSQKSRDKIAAKATGRDHSHEYKPVDQYDLQDNFVAHHVSITAAGIALGDKAKEAGIRKMLYGTYKQAYGYKWKLS